MKMDKGPEEVMMALLSGDEEQIKEALAFQRESFRAKFGCYPEELKEVKKYRVKLVRTDHFNAVIEAENEEEAMDAAYAMAPEICAQDSGWGQDWGVDIDDWQDIEDFYGKEYDSNYHGLTIEEEKDE